MVSFLKGAMPLIELGWSVFPLSPGTKLPAIPKTAGGQGVLDASSDPEQIWTWARRFPSANVGLACGKESGLTVIDVDPKNGGSATVASLKAKKQEFTPTILVKTPSGGWHMYYRYEPLLLNSKSKLGVGIDVRAQGGYVVAPPSVAGNPYRWVNAPLGPDIPKMPRWVFEKLKPAPQPVRKAPERSGEPSSIDGLVAFIGRAAQGERNGSLYWAACRAAEDGMTDDATALALENAGVAIGLDPKEAHKTVMSAFKARRRLA